MASPFWSNAASVLLNTHTTWLIDSLPIMMFADIEGKIPKLVDLCEFIKEDPSNLVQHIDFDGKLYFPQSVTGTIATATSTMKHTNVHDCLNGCCHNNGFTLNSAGCRQKNRQYPQYKLICRGHGRIFRSRSTSKYARQEVKTSLSSKEQCPFYLPAFLDKGSGWLFVPRNSGRCFCHKVHSYRPPESTDTSLTDLPQPVLAVAVKLIEKHMPPNMVNVILEATQGKVLESQHLSALKQLALNKKHSKTKDDTPDGLTRCPLR